MENPEIRRRKIKHDRRKEKGERTHSGAPDGEGESPPVKKRKVRKSTAYEDVIDGFAIRSFKTYEDLQRAVASESGQPQAVNESQESGARISGSGSGDNSKVGTNESPSKESGKSSASTKSPKSKKKKLSTTNQENETTVMQPDLSRCSGESGDHGNGNGGSGPGNILEAGISQSLNSSHPHSFSHFQQQQQHFPLSEPVTALKPHPQQQPKKVRVSKDVCKNHICKMEDGGNDGTNKKPEDHKELFAASRRDSLGKTDAVENLHRHATQIVKVAETATQHSIHLLSELKSNRATSISTSTSTSIDHPQKPPTSPLHSGNSLSTTVATQFSSQSSVVHIQNHQKAPSAPPRALSSLPGFSPSSENPSVEDLRGNSVAIKTEPLDVSPEAADVKSFSNGPVSPTKRQLEVNGRNHHAYLTQPPVPDVEGVPAPVSQQSSHTSQAAFTPISQQSPKSANSGSLHPAQQQVVAPISNPKEKFGQGRIGSQTLFTPYATTAITRVRSPLGGGGPPPASNACSGSQSSVTTVIQPESPKEVTPIGSPYISLPHHSPHHHHPHNQHQHQHHPPHHINNVKNNQHIYNNRIKGTPNNNYSGHPVGCHYTTSVNSSANNYHSTDTNNGNSKQPHSSSSSSTKSYQAQHNSSDYSNSPSAGSLVRPPIENSHRKDHGNLDTSEYKDRPSLPNFGSRIAPSASHHKVPSTPKDKATVPTSKSNAALAFGSIARLLDSPASSSSSSNLPLSAKNPIPQHHPQHHHHHHHNQHIPASNNHNHHHTYHHHHPNINSNSYGGVPPHCKVTASAASVSATQSLQHPGSSSSAGSNSSASTIPIGTIGYSSGTLSVSQGAALSGNQSNSLAASASTQSCSSRSHSPRGHSPTRERDSYSSNVSSLSRSSATPVSGSQPPSHLSLPPNLSPQLQSSSYSKAASWLSTVPGLSPVPRPTPPPPPASHSGHHPGSAVGTISGHLSLPPSSVANHFGGYPGVTHPHSLQSPHSAAAANMFAPPILPLSSISAHPASQPPAFGPTVDPLFPGQATSDMVRRDLESRLISGDRSVAGGPSPFLTRPSDLHHHHPLLPPLSGVGHLPPHNPGAPPSGHPPPHSALFPPPLFKDLPKVGMDSPFYRTSMGISYPGFNGMLPPPGLATPFAPPTQLPTYTQKKTGKWNAMHVRIAWEIYQHQQRGGSTDGASKSGSSSTASSSSSKGVNPSSSAVSAASVTEMSTPPVVATSTGPPTSLTADLLRSSSHAFTGLGRPGEAHPPFTAPMLSPHAPPPHASTRGTPYDPLFLNSTASHLGPPLPRYPGFGALGPSFAGGLSGLGSSLLGRDLSSLVALSPGQDQWARFPTRPPFPGTSNSLNWQVQQRLEQRDSKTPTETRRQKESDERSSRERESRGRDSSPFRDRSPIRTSRTTPQENGDGDSRSSRSNDSHSNSTSAVRGGRSKDDSLSSNGERDRASTPILSPYDRERIAQAAEKSVPSHAASHPSRIYPPSSPLSSAMPGMSAWDAFPGFLGAAPRMSLSLLQLSERERELARIPPSSRSGLFSNGPYGPLPLGVLGPMSSVAPGSATTTASGSSKSSPLLNASIPPSPVSHSHLHSSQQQNGSNSPIAGSCKTQNQSEDKQLPNPPPSHGNRTKEESHQSR